MQVCLRTVFYLPLLALAACGGGGSQVDSPKGITATDGTSSTATAATDDRKTIQAVTPAASASGIAVTPGGVTYSLPLWTTICRNTPPANRRGAQVPICEDVARRNSTSGGQSLSEVLTRLEASGQTPILDRSSSLMGPDTNANGVRDDIDSYITAKNVSDPQSKALRLLSKAISSAITANIADPNSLQAATAQLNNAVTCVWKLFPPSSADGAVQEMQKVTVNTRERYTAYMNYNGAVAGTVIKRPREVSCE